MSSYNLALPIRRVSSGSTLGWLGRLGRFAAVTNEARGASEIDDHGQEAHASAAARASFDVELLPEGDALRAHVVYRLKNLPRSSFSD